MQTNLTSKHVYIAVISFLLLILVLFVFLYELPYGNVQHKITSLLHLPVGKVGGSFVYSSDIDPYQSAGVGTVVAFQKYAEAARMTEVMRELKVVPKTNAEENSVAMRIGFMGNKTTNPRFASMEAIKRQVESGVAFGDLARSNSDDPATKNFDGDAGFVGIDDMLPELGLALHGAKKDSLQIIPTRDGLELVRVLEVVSGSDTGELIHLQHIFLQDNAFENWLTMQLNKATAVLYVRASSK